MKKIEDIKSIFLIFPIKCIDKNLTLLLNEKIKEIKYTILDKKPKNFDLYFVIFDNLLICNENNNLDLCLIAELLNINYEITSKYFFYLIKNKEMSSIVLKLKTNIINFFVLKNRYNAEGFFSLLLLSEDDNKLYCNLNCQGI